MTNMKTPIKPTMGYVLQSEFLTPRGITPIQFAHNTGLPLETISGILSDSIKLTDELAQPIGQYLHIPATILLQMQDSFTK